MRPVPCPVCGYHAPEEECPHCAGTSAEPSLARPPSTPLGAIADGLAAVPRGFWFLATTRGVKRWLVPPFVLTFVLLVALLWWSFALLNGLLESALPDSFEFGEEGWGWLAGLEERWGWVHATVVAVVAAAEWVVNLGWGILTSQPLRVLSFFLLGSLVAWYCFSIAYEAFAGPFLDEVQARFETRWFGADPRARLERPNDIPEERCLALTSIAGGVALVVLLVCLFVDALPWWLGLLLAPLPFAAGHLYDRRFGPWLRWMAKVEGRATLASLQAAFVTGVLLILALPLYFVPGVGYFLFAGACGFATAVGLLDIPFERRGWSFRMRLFFLGRNLPALIAFGVAAGVLLAVPVLGPILMVPSASVGGLWLVCRLSKDAERAFSLRGTGPTMPGPPAGDPE